MVNLYTLSAVHFAHGSASPTLIDISASVNVGEHVSLLGANGAGKSTLLYLLAGLYFPTEGELKYRDINLSREAFQGRELTRNFRRNVQIVFQDPDAQLFCSTVREEVAYGAKQVYEEAEAAARVDEALTAFGLNHVADQVPFALSLGEKRRTTLACAMAVDPEVLLLDEPTANLDAATIDFTVDWLTVFGSRNGKTIVLATHELWLSHVLTSQAIVLTPCHRLARAGDTQTLLMDHSFMRSMNLAGKRPWGDTAPTRLDA